MEEQDIMLIDTVRDNPILYKKPPLYTSLNQGDNRAQAWANVADEVGLTPERCKTRFKTLRDSYNRFKKKNEGPKYKYAQHLSFLDEIDTAPKTKGGKKTSQSGPVIISVDDDSADFRNLLVMHKSQATDTEVTDEVTEVDIVEDEDEAQVLTEISYSRPLPTLQMRPQTEVYTLQFNENGEAVAQESNLVHSAPPLDSGDSSQSARGQSEDEEDIPTEALLVYMGKVLKSLPFQLRLQAKSKLFRDLQSFEEQYLRGKSTDGYS